MKFTKLGVAKAIATGIVGSGTTKIVKQIISNNVPTETLYEKVTVGAAAWVIGIMAAVATKDTTGKMIDDVVETGGKIAKTVKIQNKLNKINTHNSTFENEGLKKEDFDLKDDKWVIREKPETEKVDEKDLPKKIAELKDLLEQYADQS